MKELTSLREDLEKERLQEKKELEELKRNMEVVRKISEPEEDQA